MSTSTPKECHNISSHPPEAIPPSTAPAVSARHLQSWPWLVPAPRPSMAAGYKCRTSSQIRWQAVPGRANAEKSEATQSWAVFGLVGSVLFSVQHVRLRVIYNDIYIYDPSGSHGEHFEGCRLPGCCFPYQQRFEPRNSIVILRDHHPKLDGKHIKKTCAQNCTNMCLYVFKNI